jgi:uncharacterized protein (DUF169 family)
MIPDLNTLNAYAEELEKKLKLKTFPIAVKLLKSEKDIPQGAIRPKSGLNQRMALCVGFMKARRDAQSLALFKEDMWCIDPVIGLGMAQPPEFFFEGKNRFPNSISCIEAGKAWSKAFPRLDAGKYAGIALAPLKSANFEPDMVIIYSDVAQLTQLLISMGWKEGRDVNARMSGYSACVYCTVPVMLSGECQVTPPCPGDARHAMAQDDEIIFTVPAKKLDDLMAGLRYLEEKGTRLPRTLTAENEYVLPDAYKTMGKAAGMDL